MTSRDDLQSHLFRLVHFARCAHMKRAISSIDPDPALNFWRLILGNLLDNSVLEWCKVFGSNAEATHWKKVVPPEEHDGFRTDLLAAVGLTAEQWADYWTLMKKYRDKQVAHYQELPPGAEYPVLDCTLVAAYYYYRYLIAELRDLGETEYPNDLEAYCRDFAKQAGDVAQLALAATRETKERVR